MSSCDMCGGELAQIGKRLVMLGEGMMEGEGKKKKKNVGKIIKKTARKVAGKKNLKNVAGEIIEKGIPATAGFVVGTAAGSATGNPLAGAAAGAATEEAIKRSGAAKKARKKAGLGHMEGHGKKPSAWIQHVKKVASEKGIPYGKALKIAKDTYKKN